MVGLRILVQVLFGIYCLQHLKANAAGTLTSDPVANNQGEVAVCPGDTATFMCSHDNVGNQATRWEVSDSAFCIVVHDGGAVPVCSPLVITMANDNTGATLDSTAELVASEALNGVVVRCRAGLSTDSDLVGSFTLRVIGSPTVPTIEPIQYSVDTVTTGRIMFTASSMGSFGTSVSYGGSASGGSLQVAGDVFMVTGLNYSGQYDVMINATSVMCPNVEPSSVTTTVTFIIAAPLLRQPVASITCSNASLPIQLSWTVDPGTQSTTDRSVALNPPLITQSADIMYSSTGGDIGNAVSASPYELVDPRKDDSYTFTVSVTNAAGMTRLESPAVSTCVLGATDSTVTTMGCLTLSLMPQCSDDVTTGVFDVTLMYGVGVCTTLADIPDIQSTTETITDTDGVCIPVATRATTQLCFNATLTVGGTPIKTVTNSDFRECLVSDLNNMLGSEVSIDLMTGISNVPHRMSVTLTCSSLVAMSTGTALCVDGNWTIETRPDCSSPASWLIAVIIVCALVIAFVIGIAVGFLVAKCWKKLTESLSDRECWALAVVVGLSFVGAGLGILFFVCCCLHRNSKPKSKDSEKLTSSPPPDDRGLYADPNAIEHEAAPGSDDQYAMVDRKGKKNKAPKPTQPEALYQDPNAIEHETAPSGDTYAVVDKPKRGSSKKKEPDVVPGPSDGLTYADIDVAGNRHRPNPASQRQAQQPVGSVEYSDVKFKEEAQL